MDGWMERERDGWMERERDGWEYIALVQKLRIFFSQIIYDLGT